MEGVGGDGKAESPSQVSPEDVIPFGHTSSDDGKHNSTQVPPIDGDQNPEDNNFVSDVSMADESEQEGEQPTNALESQQDVPLTTNTHANEAMDWSDAPREKCKSLDSSACDLGGPHSQPEMSRILQPEGEQSDQALTTRHVQGDRSLLPAEIWHHIFTFCPPRTLGNLLQANKLFNSYLDPASSVRCDLPTALPRSASGVLGSAHIWRASRRLFWPGLPKPLHSRTELDMWRLACSRRCQHCGKLDAEGLGNTSDPWHQGPGSDGVAVVWPFTTRSCGSCLVHKSLKEVDLLFSPSIPSIIVPGLNFVLMTSEHHVVKSTAIELGQRPPDLQITKFFWSSDIEELKQEFTLVRNMGQGAAEEWLKGLEGRAADRRYDSLKWEKWEASGGISLMRKVLYPGYACPEDTSAGPGSVVTVSGSQMLHPAVDSDPPPNGQQPLSTGAGSHLDMRNQTGPSSFVATSYPSNFRSKEALAMVKSSRRAEIEKRAQQLEPPLGPGALARTPAFQAAIQIIAPLDDNAWEILRPRLLAQRAEAEERERESIRHAELIRERDERLRREAANKEIDWENIQAPLRARIAGYADEVLRDGWDRGKKVTKENCGKFAVDVLLYVRKRFYAEVAKDAAAARAAGQEPIVDPPEGPFTQKLTLENMKWVFDTKIKPHTDAYRKEIFFCSGCEVTLRPYSFEGVIQHYAAKHTNELSLGSVVVFWRSAWPEAPPFSPEGRSAKIPFGGVQNLPRVPQGPYVYNGYNAPPTGPPDSYGPPVTFPPPPAPGYAPNPYPQPAPFPPYQSASTPSGPYHIPGPDMSQAFGPPAPPASVPPPGLPGAPGGYDYNYAAYQNNAQIGYPLSGPSYASRLDDMARNAREIWNATTSIKDLPGNWKVFLLLHHIVSRFRSKFAETPPLTMFIDGLNNHRDLRPSRNVNGLACKACTLGLGNAPTVQQDRKTFSLPQLVNHFQSKHIEPMQNAGVPPLDWTVDMVLLPDASTLQHVVETVHPGSLKYYLLTDALPQLFQPISTAPAPPPGAPVQIPYAPHPEFSAGYHDEAVDNHGFYAPREESNIGRTAEPGAPPGTFPSGPMPNQLYGYGRSHPELAPQLGQEQAIYLAGNMLPGSVHVANAQMEDPRSTEDRKLSISEEVRTNRKQRKANAKSGRGKTAGAAKTGPMSNIIRKLGLPDKSSEEEVKIAEEEVRREEEIRAMWAADRAGTAHAYTSSAVHQSDRGEAESTGPNVLKRTSSGRVSTAPKRVRTPGQYQRSPSPRTQGPFHEPEKPSLTAALEMHLDHEESRHNPEPMHRPTRNVIYIDDDAPVVPHGTRRSPEPQPRYDVRERGRSRSPAYAPYGETLPARPYRQRSPVRREPEPLSQPGPPRYVEDVGYERGPRVEESPFERAARQNIQYERPRHDVPYQRPARPEDEVYARRPRQDYYRANPTDPPPRQYVEAYEIVQVRDETGEYYIRRPVRHGPEPYEPYAEERAIRREADPYPMCDQPRTRHAPRPALPHPHHERPYDGRDPVPRAEPPPLSRPEPAYYEEEYDPRFPAGRPPPPPAVMRNAARQIRYQ